MVQELPLPLRLKLPFLAAGSAAFLFSVFLFFVRGDTTAGMFVGLWVPSIYSLGALLLSPVAEDPVPDMDLAGQANRFSAAAGRN